MLPSRFRALLVEQDGEGAFRRLVTQRELDSLPEADALIEVHYSSLNYKDALSASGHAGVTRRYPHTPGIDAAGVIARCSDGTFEPGDPVIVTGYDLGMNTSGGLAEYIAVPSGWIVPKPDGLSLRDCMVLGTAGFTAAWSVDALATHALDPAGDDVLVTGATGGVGNLAVALLSNLGHRVAALTGKSDQHDALASIGAADILDREALLADANRPLLKGRWQGAVDTVGGDVLDTVLRSIRPGGAVAACGMAMSPDLHTNVYPFILRQVSLIGIASADCAMPLRRRLWDLLSGDWRLRDLEHITREIDLDQVSARVDEMLAGRSTGRTVVRVRGDSGI
ncbi:MAG: oxidoreductase [Phycisphaeraceae bacterium]|nr:oxidoreductase [Phycisphaeraceae bacterium]